MRINKLIVLCSVLFGMYPGFVFAMGSTNYAIDSDVIGASGDIGNSSNYQLNDTTGEVGTGDSASTNYGVQAGFWSASNVITVSITSPSNVSMGAITGTGQSILTTNAATWNIKTNNSAGYSLAWQASAAAMTSGTDTIAAYTPASANVPEVWSVAGSDSEWGAHVGAASTSVNTSAWGIADTYAAGKWLNINNATPLTIATRSSATSIPGDDEIIYFGSEVGSSKLQPTGTYAVDVTMTAVTL